MQYTHVKTLNFPNRTQINAAAYVDTISDPPPSGIGNTGIGEITNRTAAMPFGALYRFLL